MTRSLARHTKKRGRTLVRTLALLAAVLALVIGPSAAAQNAAKPTHVTVQLAWLMNTQSAALAAAVKEGFYKQHGLDVTLHAGGVNVDPVKNVVSGQMQFGVANSSGTLILARSHGIPIVSVGALYQKHPFGFFYLPNSGITTPKDLKGKTIGIQSTARYLLKAFLNKNGLKLSDVHIVTVASGAAPLAQHRVDAISAWVVDAAQLKAVPNAKHFLTFDYGLHFYANPIFTTDKYIQQHPEVVKNFVAATMEGLDFAIQHPEKATEDTLALAPNLDKAGQLETLKLSIPLFTSPGTKEHGLGYMNPLYWQQAQTILLNTDQMTHKVDVNALFTNKFIDGNTPKR